MIEMQMGQEDGAGRGLSGQPLGCGLADGDVEVIKSPAHQQPEPIGQRRRHPRIDQVAPVAGVVDDIGVNLRRLLALGHIGRDRARVAPVDEAAAPSCPFGEQDAAEADHAAAR